MNDPAIGDRPNPSPNTGLSTDSDGNLFDVTEWRQLQGLHGTTNELLRDVIQELRTLNLKIDEALSCK